MDRVFVYGRPVSVDNFIAREEETKRVKMTLTGGINSIIIAPCGMGKTSLVKQVISEVKKEPNIITIYMDIRDCRTEYEFYQRFFSSIMVQTAPYEHQRTDNLNYSETNNRTNIEKGTNTQLSVSEVLSCKKSLSLDKESVISSPDGVLNLSETIAKKLGKHIIICIDEFQQIARMRDSLTIQRRLRSVWQHHHNCSYCFIGSNEPVMSNMFLNYNMPFYLSGDILRLKPIPTQDWIDYIQKRFESWGKQISPDLCQRICEITQNRSSYVQQLAWNVFVQTSQEADEECLSNGLDYLMMQCNAFFKEKLAGLTSNQIKLFRAITGEDGVHCDITSKSIIEDYQLGTISNIKRVISSLRDKDLIERRSEGWHFQDPIFAIWFAKNIRC